MTDKYNEFLKAKIVLASDTGIQIDAKDINVNFLDGTILKPHQKDAIQWAIRGGCRALFESFGLGKTIQQLIICQKIIEREGGKSLIIAPLGVKQEFYNDAENKLGIKLQYVKTLSECKSAETPYLITNYERVRDGDIDPNYFKCTSLDEASVLRSYGSKTYQEFLKKFKDVQYKFVATATPSPNKYKELIHYAGYLGIMDTGQALAQPLYSKILTPDGWITMGDIKPNDYVISVDGKKTKVLSIHPQGKKDIFRVYFSDDSYTDCTGDHLWETQTQYERNACKKYIKRNGYGSRYSDYFTVKDTNAISNSLKCTSTSSKNHSIPIVKPVEFNERKVLVDPYIMGLILGDGHIRQTSICFSSQDDWIIKEIERLIHPLQINKNNYVRKDGQKNYDYSISTNGKKGGSGYGKNNVLTGFQKYNLCGKRAWEKEIPEDYIYNTKEVRIAVLQGLMDTDGTISKNIKARTPKLITTSSKLSQNIKTIVESLGGTVNINNRQGITPSGNKGRIQYHVSIMLPYEINPFRMPRKAELVLKRKKYNVMRYITKVEKIGNDECQCIYVEDKRHLYITDNFIVTHNTRFFHRDSTKANNLTLYPHKEQEFWLWVSSWALFITKPSDLGYDDAGYELPPLNIKYHKTKVDHTTAGTEQNGQVKMFRDAALSLKDASKEKRDSIDDRIAQMLKIVKETKDDEQIVIWCDLDSEQNAIEKILKSSGYSYTSLRGSHDIEYREEQIKQWKNKQTKCFVSKPVMYGSGINMQQAHIMIFVGIGYKFADFIQAIHREYRFMQQHIVDVNIIYAESEDSILKTLLSKWEQHNYLVEQMIKIIKENGLNIINMETKLARSIGIKREETTGHYFKAVLNDNVIECKAMEDNSIDLIHTSIPFSNHYEYTPSYNDFGHNKDNDAFFEQMDFLTPELLRILKPGRVCAVHVKDRVLFGNATGDGMPTIDPFSDMTVFHYLKHGFRYFGRITIVTDVVRENNQTYRLGWTEQCKDGSKMGVGCPEYILLFRKLPTDTSRAYADDPVMKTKTDYTRAQWQIDAHGFWRSSGNRLAMLEDFENIEVSKLQNIYRKWSRGNIYEYKDHVDLAKTLDVKNKLPAAFMVVAPGSWSDKVWDDVNRMITLNSRQAAKNLQMHICPLQLDIVERIINRFSNKGDLVLDPFGGLMTVPYVAIKNGRRGIGIELNIDSYVDGITHLQNIEEKIFAPTLFDIIAEDVTNDPENEETETV